MEPSLENKSMKYYIAILLAAFAAAACTGKKEVEGTSASKPSKVYKWRLVTTWPKNFPGLGIAPERFAKMVKEMSSGRLKVKVYGAGELVPALEVFDAVSRGSAQMGHGSGYYWKGKVPQAQFFAAVPFGLNAQEMNGWLHHGGGLKLWEEIYKPFGVIPMAGGNTGVQMGGWFNREINSPEDIRGLKMRIPGLGGEVFQRAGGVPVLLPGGEIFTALQTGAIDATEWVGPYNDLAFGLHKAAKFYYYPGWHEAGTALEFMINEKAFLELPKDLQGIVRYAARVVNHDLLDEYTYRNALALKTLVSEHGIQVKAFPTDVLEMFKQHSKQLLVELAEADPQSKKILESIEAFRSVSADNLKITEQAYFEVR